MFICLECHKNYMNPIDFYHHLVYDELYDEKKVKRLSSIGVFNGEETKNILHYINMEIMK